MHEDDRRNRMLGFKERPSQRDPCTGKLNIFLEEACWLGHYWLKCYQYDWQ